MPATPQAPKILFANVPFDGHFSPLTGLAMHLVNKGYDVRWYSGLCHERKIAEMGIPMYPFKRALELNQHNTDELFPERKKIKGKMAKLKFDINRFIDRAPEYYEDIREIHGTFSFDILICDVVFTGAALIKELMDVPVLAIGVVPLSESSRDLPPSGMAMLPAKNRMERLKHAVLRYVSRRFIFNDGLKRLNSIYAHYQLPPYKGVLLDVMCKKADLLLQSGTPGFEYKRSDLGNNVRFIGPLLPYCSKAPRPFTAQGRLMLYDKVILVTQGTVEKDPEKLLVPTLEAFKDTAYMVVATTGGFNTEELRKRFPQKNILIEDFIDFDQIMPLAHVYVTNGGYGGVMLSVKHRLPMVVAGEHEGKNEINARVGYFGLGVNLRTEAPDPQQVRAAVENVLQDTSYRNSVAVLAKEFLGYEPAKATERYVKALLHMRRRDQEIRRLLVK
ncbi:nucleotide disphospho-sugar-binding domain-containing protein [uncultured Chitinophaga sp.]|uniref:glycosyltransferase n=1 Tax=uncultured Chitinophaga sp. TaxID=339340 RepID=UPI0025F2A0A2|nr:nucleotide disphospho-sugar-binding domain-containing protein [uncultured Chitinophaga sp.]